MVPEMRTKSRPLGNILVPELGAEMGANVGPGRPSQSARRGPQNGQRIVQICGEWNRQGLASIWGVPLRFNLRESPSHSDGASEPSVFGYIYCGVNPLASERAATSRGPMGPSANEDHLIINPWQTVPLLSVILTYSTAKKLAHHFIQTPDRISLKGCPRHDLRPSGEAYHRLAGPIQGQRISTTLRRRWPEALLKTSPRGPPNQAGSRPIFGAIWPALGFIFGPKLGPARATNWSPRVPLLTPILGSFLVPKIGVIFEALLEI